jgi:hypothetical protein
MGVEAGMPLTPAGGSLHDELHGLLLNHFTTTALTNLAIEFRLNTPQVMYMGQ